MRTDDRLRQAVAALQSAGMAAAADSHVAGIDPRALLLVTVGYLVGLLSVPLLKVGMVICFAAYPIILAPMAHVAYERVLVKSLYVLPLLLAIAVFNPLFDHRVIALAPGMEVSAGWATALSVVVRGLLAMQALLLLVGSAGFIRVCAALRALKVPSVLVTQLLMVYRYLIVLLSEALSMHRARVARAYGSRGGYRPSMWGPMVGQLLLRSLDRARRIHLAMLARGFDGSLMWSRLPRWSTADTVYCLVWGGVFVLLRFVDIPSFIVSSVLSHNP